jgi:hypothetical protein
MECPGRFGTMTITSITVRYDIQYWYGNLVTIKGGAITGFNAIVSTLPDIKLGLIFLTNSAGVDDVSSIKYISNVSLRIWR